MPVTHGVASSSLVQTANNIEKALQVKYLRGFVFVRFFPVEGNTVRHE